VLHLILGGAALQRCDNRFVFTSGFSRRGQAVRHERIFQQPASAIDSNLIDGEQFIPTPLMVVVLFTDDGLEHHSVRGIPMP